MKFKEIGLVLASLTVSMVGIGSSASSAQAASFFGEDVKYFATPGSTNQVTDAPDVSKLTNSYAAEQLFLKALTGTYKTVNFEESEGLSTNVYKVGTAFNYTSELTKADGTAVTMNIFDANSGSNQSLHTSIQKTGAKSGKNTNLSGGRYGISDAGLTQQERLNNQFLNTNAGKDSNLTFSFSEAISGFGFYGTDFERGAIMGYELTRADGTTKYVSLPLTLSDPNAAVRIRGTAFYSGYLAESQDDYFTKVQFKIQDGKEGTNDIVAFDRMTFASAPNTKHFSQAQAVPEPSLGFLALGAVVSGAAFKRRKKA